MYVIIIGLHETYVNGFAAVNMASSYGARRARLKYYVVVVVGYFRPSIRVKYRVRPRLVGA